VEIENIDEVEGIIMTKKAKTKIKGIVRKLTAVREGTAPSGSTNDKITSALEKLHKESQLTQKHLNKQINI